VFGERLGVVPAVRRERLEQEPLSVTARKRAPSGSTRIAEMPPKASFFDVSVSPPRNSNAPKRVRDASRLSNDAIGSA